MGKEKSVHPSLLYDTLFNLAACYKQVPVVFAAG